MTNRTGRPEDEFLPVAQPSIAGARPTRARPPATPPRRPRTWVVSVVGAALVLGLGYLGHTMAVGSSVVGDDTTLGAPNIRVGGDRTEIPPGAFTPGPDPTASGSGAGSAPVSGDTPSPALAPAVGPGPGVGESGSQARGTATFSVLNVAPRVRIVEDFAGGPQRGETGVQVQLIDDNLLAGARLELCLRAADATCVAERGRAATWTVVVTGDAPIIAAAGGNSGWALELRSRTGSSRTATATYGFAVTIGANPGKTPWVLEARIVDDGGQASTVVGVPAAITQPAQPRSDSFVDRASTVLWPF